MKRPLIGIVPLVDAQRESYWMLPGYMRGVEQAGGLPIMLPLTDDDAALRQLADTCDGFLLTGGQDVSPALYGAAPAPACGETCPARDAMETKLLALALEQDKPVLGICRGIQFLNVYLGGTLYQDLPTEHPSAAEHHQKPPYDVPLSKIDRTFYDVDEEQLAVLNRIPENVLEAAAEIVDLANEKMDNQFRENVVFTLADHIDFSVQRYRKNINIKLPLFYEVRQLYPKESEIGKQALNILKKRLDIALPREEAAAIALHFVNYKAQAETTPDIDYGSIIEQATGIIEQELQVTVDRDSFNYYRFVTHMHYMMKRTLDDTMIDSQNRELFESMKKEYPSIYSCSVKVAALIEQQLKKSLSEEEILYLILHINRLCAREDCDR